MTDLADRSRPDLRGAAAPGRRRVAVRFEGVSRHFGAVKAVDRVDLTIHEGEFFAMLGPSGSGKTTCLRLIGGFEQPSAGHIEIFGETAEGLPPYRRSVNTVFQDYALFPHLSVIDNVAYGLMVRGIDRRTRLAKAAGALALVRLSGLDTRRPSQLSGGQRQRVALARALVNEPSVLLLDEPLGALDLKLREEMQVELRKLHQRLGLTFVFVTHDQGEALSMADRVAVFNEGRVQQVDSPETIYQRPATRFVADFVGGSNVLEPAAAAALGGRRAWTSLRPERIAVTRRREPGSGPGGSAVVTDVQYQGAVRRLALDLAGLRLQAVVPADEAAGLAPGDAVTLAWPADAMHVMDGEAEPRG